MVRFTQIGASVIENVVKSLVFGVRHRLGGFSSAHG